MTQSADRVTIGLISDTHGLLRASVHEALAGVDMILHAGDVGGSDILHELRMIAPVQAVFGNTDPVDDPELSESFVAQAGGVAIRVVHGHGLGSPTPAKLVAAYTEPIIVYGHTHRQLIERLGDQLVINPGAAGARRFNLAPSVARLAIDNGKAKAVLIAIN